MRRARMGQRAGRGVVALLAGATAGGIIVSAIVAASVLRADRAPLERLADVVGPHRVTRARLTGGFAYTSCDTAAPNDSLIVGLICERTRPEQWPEAGALTRFARDLRAAGSTAATAAADLHAAGGWRLIWGELEAAIDKLRLAAREAPTDARVQSDLAAAYLARAEQKQDPLSIVEAYEAVDSALALDPRLHEARFNRAVILEWLYLENDAIAAWSSYLEVDGRSHWADEARARLSSLKRSPPSWSAEEARLQSAIVSGSDSTVREIVARFPWRGRERVRDGLIGWARAYENGDHGADTVLRQADVIARALRDVTGDALWEDATRAIIDAGVTNERGRQVLIARGLADYGKGRAELGRVPLDSTQHRLEAAKRALILGKSAASHLAEYELGRVAGQRQTTRGYDDALKRFNQVLAVAPESYRSVRALAMRNVAFLETLRFKYDVALASYTASIREGVAIGEPVLELRARTDAARLLADVRGERVAWRLLYDGFRALPRYPEANTDAQRLFTRAADLSWQHVPAVAPLFQAELVRLARAVGEPLLMTTALTREAELFAHAGRSDLALQTLQKVREYAHRIEDDSIRMEMNTNADLIAGEASLRLQPDSAIRLLKQVTERYRKTQYVIQVVRANLLLANAYAVAGAMDSARSAFEAALAEKERQRSELSAFDDRARFMDHARPVIDSLVRFLIERSDTLGAFDFFEKMRARVLLERVTQGMPNVILPTRPGREIARGLPPRTSVISYAILDDELVAWLIRREGISMARVPLDRQLEHLVGRFTTLIGEKSQGTEIHAVASSLHQLLIAPFQDRIEPESKLVLVPDKWLHYVPFAALFDDRRGKFLIESNEIAIAPSVRLFMESTARYEALRSTAQPVVLAVGNPSFDRRTYALPLLPGAEREARGVAGQYPGSTLLVGPDATKAAFLQAAKSSNLIHFAGHGVVRPDAPLLSQLVLAPDAGADSPGALYAKDLYGITLPATRLAILSGCHTGGGEMSETEGTSSLARALFAAGVPAVIASLWAVDDQQTTEFFTRYHRELTRGVDPTVALRRTQSDWIGRTRKSDAWGSISTWAAFQLFGGTGESLSQPNAVKKMSARPSSISRAREMAYRRPGL